MQTTKMSQEKNGVSINPRSAVMISESVLVGRAILSNETGLFTHTKGSVVILPESKFATEIAKAKAEAREEFAEQIFKLAWNMQKLPGTGTLMVVETRKIAKLLANYQGKENE